MRVHTHRFTHRHTKRQTVYVSWELLKWSLLLISTCCDWFSPVVDLMCDQIQIYMLQMGLFFLSIFLLHFKSDSNLNDNLSPSDWLSDVWTAVWTTITSRQRWPSYDGDKRSYVKEEKTREERKKSVEKRAFKGLQNDKEIEWGGRRDNASGGAGGGAGGSNRKEVMNRIWVCLDFGDFPGVNSWWEVTGVGDNRCGTVLLMILISGPPQTTKGNDLTLQSSTIKPRQTRGEKGRKEAGKKRETAWCVC